ncbi:MAG: helix-turn-helix domain-containing protein [Ignavibacteriales bacterium]|nr:helix-turn-helix domain-containing protein [Ignavibacteriales bacterium]MCB9258339.1 helix-turn-helix domain-containing protein [Ignavibacteriales bacterium]
MKKVIILVPQTAIPAAIVDPQYMFFAINNFFKEAGQEPFFNFELVGLTQEVTLNFGSVTIHTNNIIEKFAQADLVIIPAISGDIRSAIELNKDFIPFIQKQHRGGAEIASLCVGAFLLASTGLLNGKQCSTHWLFANQFREMFPEVKFAEDKIITDQNGIYTSGGATSYWNLLLYLVEKYTSKEMAIMASKFFLLDIDKSTQLPFRIFKGQKEHKDGLILSAQNYIEENFTEKLTVDELAERFNLGRRTFERRFKKATTNTIIEYIQRVKVEAAKVELEKGRKTVSEIMYDVGYTDSKSFRDVFKKFAGMSPVDYRNRFN